MLPNLKYFEIILKIWVYFQAFKNSYPQERSWKHEKNLKLKVLVSENKISAPIPIPKLDLGLVPDTETRFRSYTITTFTVYTVLQKINKCSNITWFSQIKINFLVLLCTHLVKLYLISFIMPWSFFSNAFSFNISCTYENKEKCLPHLFVGY